MNEITPTRRAMLGVLATAPMLAAIPAMAQPAPVERAEWERVANAWRTAKDDVDRFDADHLAPVADAYLMVRDSYPRGNVIDLPPEAQRHVKSAWDAYDPVQSRFDELVGAQLKASNLVIETTPPDAQAFAEKMEIALIEIDGAEMNEEWCSRLIADARRFSGALVTGGNN